MIFLVSFLQRIFGVFGLHVSRRARGVSVDDALSEQLRLAGPEPKIIFEVGAADGRDTLEYAKRCPHAEIHAFEPLPASFAKLETLTRPEPRIKSHKLALSNFIGQTDFNLTALDDASSLLPSVASGGTYDKYLKPAGKITVEVSTIDEICGQSGVDRIDILKLDAQGAEGLVLQGAERLLNNRAIKVIYTEVNFCVLYEGQAYYHDIAALLHRKGYGLHSLYNLVKSPAGELSWADAIFVIKT